MRVLLELRPALDGHAGIPQETRLLFRGLAGMEGVDVLGLIQSSNLVVDAGLPLLRGRLADAREAAHSIDRLSQVVVSLQQGASANRLEHVRKKFLKLAGPISGAAKAVVGLKVPLTGFDAAHFKDYVWRAFFARTLPVEDFNAVTTREFRILRWPWAYVNALGAATGAMGHALYPRVDTEGIDLMIAETPYPGRVNRGTQLVVRYHDAIPLLMPHTIKDRGHHRAMHYRALKRNAADGAWFACVSEATRSDLLSVLPEVASRAVTIPNMISHNYFAETASAARVPEIIWSRKNRQAPYSGGAEVEAEASLRGDLPYLLMVSTVEPRKNYLALLDAWELLRNSGFPHLHLVCVGNLGWDHEAIMRRFTPWLGRGGLHLLEDVPAADLRLLYRHARLTVCPSFGEGFDFSGVEAMRSGGVVVASDIAVHREVYADAAEYFSPYSAAMLASCMRDLLDTNAASRREQLVLRGKEVSARYLPERVMPQWQDFLLSLASVANPGDRVRP